MEIEVAEGVTTKDVKQLDETLVRNFMVPAKEYNQERQRADDAEALLREARGAVVYALAKAHGEVYRDEMIDLLARIDEALPEGE